VSSRPGRRADRSAARPRPRREPAGVRTRPQALREPRRSRLEFSRVLLRAESRAGTADGGPGAGARLAELSRQDPAHESRRLHPRRQPGARRCAQPRVHVRAPQSAGHGLRSGRAPVRIRARAGHRRRGQPHRRGAQLRLAADRRLQGRPVLHVRELVGVRADAVREPRVRFATSRARCRRRRSPA